MVNEFEAELLEDIENTFGYIVNIDSAHISFPRLPSFGSHLQYAEKVVSNFFYLISEEMISCSHQNFHRTKNLW